VGFLEETESADESTWRARKREREREKSEKEGAGATMINLDDPSREQHPQLRAARINGTFAKRESFRIAANEYRVTPLESRSRGVSNIRESRFPPSGLY